MAGKGATQDFRGRPIQISYDTASTVQLISVCIRIYSRLRSAVFNFSFQNTGKRSRTRTLAVDIRIFQIYIMDISGQITKQTACHFCGTAFVYVKSRNCMAITVKFTQVRELGTEIRRNQPNWLPFLRCTFTGATIFRKNEVRIQVNIGSQFCIGVRIVF